jgi:antitoxin MazE
MTIKIIRIGNSRGIRLPKKILEEFNLHDNVHVEIKEEGLLIKNNKVTRKGWESRIKEEISQSGYPESLITDELDHQFDTDDWEW